MKIYQGIYEKIYKKSENVEVDCYENTSFYNKFSIALDGAANNISEGINNISRIVGGIICAIVTCFTMYQIDKFTITFLIAPLLGNFVIVPKLNKIGNKRYKDTIPYDRVMVTASLMFLPILFSSKYLATMDGGFGIIIGFSSQKSTLV